MSFSIYDILKENTLLQEADDDNQDTETTEDNGGEDTTSSSDSSDTSGDDDFSIDSDMAEDSGDNNDDSLDLGGDSDSGDGSSSDSSDDEDDTSDEALEDNTDIFSSLTAEEQKIKIKELKNLFNQLYTTFDDISEKINDIPVEEYNKHELTRLGFITYDFKRYINDYISYLFPQKSYFENDVAYNRFLDILHTINEVLNKIASDKERFEKEEKV